MDTFDAALVPQKSLGAVRHFLAARAAGGTAEALAQAGFEERAAGYAENAATTLGFVDDKRALTASATALLATKEGSEAERTVFRHALEQSKLFRELVPDLLHQLEPDQAELAVRLAKRANLSAATAKRRAHELIGWRRALLVARPGPRVLTQLELPLGEDRLSDSIGRMPASLSALLVAPLREPHHVVGFATVVLYRMNNEIGHVRAVPTPGGNVVGEALTLASSSCGLQPLDMERVRELVGAKAGSGIAMCWKDPEAKIVGRTVDLVLRAIARPDQAPHCAARTGDLMQELQRLLYSDPRVVDAERAFESQLAKAILGVGPAPVTPQVLTRVNEYARPALASHAASARGRDWTEAFGAAASTYAGPEWRDPFDDAFLSDGRDVATTRKSNAEGWLSVTGPRT